MGERSHNVANSTSCRHSLHTFLLKHRLHTRTFHCGPEWSLAAVKSDQRWPITLINSRIPSSRSVAWRIRATAWLLQLSTFLHLAKPNSTTRLFYFFRIW